MLPEALNLRNLEGSLFGQKLTMRRNDLGRLGRSAYIPCGKRAIWVTAHKLFPLVMPSHRVDRLQAKQKMSNQPQEKPGQANYGSCVVTAYMSQQ